MIPGCEVNTREEYMCCAISSLGGYRGVPTLLDGKMSDVKNDLIGSAIRWPWMRTTRSCTRRSALFMSISDEIESPRWYTGWVAFCSCSCGSSGNSLFSQLGLFPGLDTTRWRCQRHYACWFLIRSPRAERGAFDTESGCALPGTSRWPIRFGITGESGRNLPMRC